MDAFFSSLNKRQTMLLLTAVAFGGQDVGALFDFLPEEEGALLKHRAKEMQKIPRAKRVPLLAQEIKRLVTARRSQLWATDPEQLALLLRRERPVAIEVVLRALPSHLAEAVRRHLPKTQVRLNREVRPEILNLIRARLEQTLERASPAKAAFKFSDVLLLQSRELLTVCDRLGARVLAIAVAGLPDEEQDAFFNLLPPDQQQLAQRAAAAATERRLDEKDARALIALHGGSEKASDALRSAGAQKLARACLAQSPEFAARVLERHRGDFGQLLLRWIREERKRPPVQGDAGRADVVAELEWLQDRGVIDRPVRLPPPRRPPIAPGHGSGNGSG